MKEAEQLKVTEVEYVVNPLLIAKFEAKQKEFMKAKKPSKPILAFHGTTEQVNTAHVCLCHTWTVWPQKSACLGV